MMWIIAILIIILTLGILKGTHVKVYYQGYSSFSPTKLWKEYDLKVPLWAAIITIILGLLPIANIILFIAFVIYYIVHVVWDPLLLDGYTHVFSLRGNNIITKGLLKIKSLLCKSI